MNIALIAHDCKKEEMIEFTKKYASILKTHQLYATGTTGLKIMENTDLKVTRFLSGPYGEMNKSVQWWLLQKWIWSSFLGIL